MDTFLDLKTANVYGVYGHLGGGKTLSSVATMVDFLKRGFTVVSNVKLKNIESFKGKYQYLEDFNNVDFWSLPVGAPRGSRSSFRSLICIDECAEFLDQYSSNSYFTKQFTSWLRHSSKRGQFVMLIVQRPEFLVKSVRLLVNKWILCDDLAQMRLPFLKIRNPFYNDCVRRILLDRLGNVISTGINNINKFEFGKYYDTAQSIATEGRQFDNNNDYEEPPVNISFFIFIFTSTFAYLKWYFR